ncbi:hypothetical protein VWBp31 [Streptomyces phage VWB]|uniref:Uncharacterized protein n=1 Tax=Streptomyces phage VWB TaxID=10702 RepID=Q6VY58_9CAUD|nr:hypothetical protein VWBp31 [Streptomyces phage VWB]AAR29721.1 hypothetical protein [Streptomyces phage VWB]
MARLQILELPEGVDDERAPFVLVVDESVPQRVIVGMDYGSTGDYWQVVAERIGARGVIVTPETLEIPANEIPLDASEHPVRLRIEADTSQFEQALAEASEAASRVCPVQREVHQMDRITDALGFDRLRDWDEIVWAIENAREASQAEKGGE